MLDHLIAQIYPNAVAMPIVLALCVFAILMSVLLTRLCAAFHEKWKHQQDILKLLERNIVQYIECRWSRDNELCWLIGSADFRINLFPARFEKGSLLQRGSLAIGCFDRFTADSIFHAVFGLHDHRDIDMQKVTDAGMTVWTMRKRPASVEAGAALAPA